MSMDFALFLCFVSFFLGSGVPRVGLLIFVTVGAGVANEEGISALSQVEIAVTASSCIQKSLKRLELPTRGLCSMGELCCEVTPWFGRTEFEQMEDEADDMAPYSSFSAYSSARSESTSKSEDTKLLAEDVDNCLGLMVVPCAAAP